MDNNDFSIKSSSRKYKVKFNISIKDLDKYHIEDNIFYIIDKKVYSLYKNISFKNIPKNRFLLIDAKEENKEYLFISKILPVLTNLSVKKDLKIISIGGGIIQDISGFISSILYRGINWIYVPTTLLAQCDSCIGSKTSINFKNYKNLLGTFWPPEEVWISTEFIKTLNTKDFYSGVGEIIKLYLIDGKKSLDFLKSLSIKSENLFRKKIFEILKRTLLIKKKFIEEDEFDEGIRNILNFGHCIGHAIESSSNYSIPHGQAVTLGIIWANIISVKLKKISIKRNKYILNNFLKKNHTISNELDLIDSDKVINAMKKDKKRKGKKLAIILMDENYNFERIYDLKEKIISESFRDFLSFTR